MSEVLNKTSEVPEKTEGDNNFSLLKLSYIETKCLKITIMLLLWPFDSLELLKSPIMLHNTISFDYTRLVVFKS